MEMGTRIKDHLLFKQLYALEALLYRVDSSVRYDTWNEIICLDQSFSLCKLGPGNLAVHLVLNS